MAGKVEKEKQKALQEKGFQLALLDQELKKVEEQYRLLDQSITNIEVTKLNLDEVKKIKNTEILASLAEGIFVKAKIDKIDKVFINVGKGIIIEKNINEAKEILNKRVEELSVLKSLLTKEAEKILGEIKSIEEEVRELAK